MHGGCRLSLVAVAAVVPWHDENQHNVEHYAKYTHREDGKYSENYTYDGWVNIEIFAEAAAYACHLFVC